MSSDLEEQQDELLALESIFDSEEFIRDESKFSGDIRVSVELPVDFKVALNEGGSLRQYDVSFLPPLLLTFELPEDYPSSSPPSFSLVCSWLTHTQLSALSSHLAELYLATGGAVVLFSWVQFLREDTLKFLDIHNLLEISSDGEKSSNLEDEQNPESSDSCDSLLASDLDSNLTSLTSQIDLNSEANPDQKVSKNTQAESSDPDPDPPGAASKPEPEPFSPSQRLLSQILIFNSVQKQKAFASSVFDCSVCFTSWLGSDCLRLNDCGHIFCQGCLGNVCKLQITRGTVRDIACPQPDCSSTLTPAQVKSLVGEEMFSRYDRLLLQSTLDRMSDVVYCPRISCNSAVILDKSSSAALCSVCGFAFCSVCRKTYHGPETCQTETKDQARTETHAALPQSDEGLKALWDDYSRGSKERRRLLEDRYGRDVMKARLDTRLSDLWVTQNTKYCPYCFWRIQKVSGCNVMMCTMCSQSFCWICLTKLRSRGSGHYESTTCSVSFHWV